MEATAATAACSSDRPSGGDRPTLITTRTTIPLSLHRLLGPTGASDRRAARLHAAAGRRAGGVLVLLRELQGLLPERADVRRGVDQGPAEVGVTREIIAPRRPALRAPGRRRAPARRP